MTKTLGQVAYEGWSASLLGPNANVRHYDIPEAIAAWQAAAEAVAYTLENESFDQYGELAQKQAAVIEAAKAFAALLPSVEGCEVPYPFAMAATRLAQDVSALEALEGDQEVE